MAVAAAATTEATTTNPTTAAAGKADEADAATTAAVAPPEVISDTPRPARLDRTERQEKRRRSGRKRRIFWTWQSTWARRLWSSLAVGARVSFLLDVALGWGRGRWEEGRGRWEGERD